MGRVGEGEGVGEFGELVGEGTLVEEGGSCVGQMDVLGGESENMIPSRKANDLRMGTVLYEIQ